MEAPKTIHVTRNLTFVKFPHSGKFACIAHVDDAPTICIAVSLRELETAVKELKGLKKARVKQCRSTSAKPSLT